MQLLSRRAASGGLLLLFGLVAWGARPLPDPLFSAPYSRVLLARDAQLLGAGIAGDGQWRFPPLRDVPVKVRRAVLEFEDRRFEWHPGVDPVAVVRALRSNIEAGRVVSGASTITMQVARLARGGQPRTLWEKAIEVELALRLELRLSKAEILALYVSHAPFGGNVVGLDAAAWRYFGRPASTLSWAEACTLAVLPNEPAIVHPGRNRSLLLAKRNRLLARLLDAGAIDALQHDLALHESLPGEPKPLPQLAPHLLATRAARLPEQAELRTTLDRNLQRVAIGHVERHAEMLARQGIHNVAALIVDNQSFEVRAYVGNSRSQFAMERGFAIDLIRRPRSTGSILKPLLYAAMLENGDILPSTLVPDVPTHFGGFRPENFDRRYRGAVPAREALARSLNVPAVGMLSRFGVARFYDELERMGMSTLHRSPDGYGLTLILGGAEANLWDVAQMYANVASIAQPRRKPATDYAGSGRAHYRTMRSSPESAESAEQRAGYSAGAAWLTLDALMEVERPQPEWREFRGARQIAWKTGTSYGLRDAWAVGATPDYTIAVWAGNASGEGVAGLSGSHSAAPLLFELFDALPPGGVERFAEPHADLRTVRVCEADGYLATSACESREERAPRSARFRRVSPNHRLVQLDSTGAFRVDSRCATVVGGKSVPWFHLPPRQEHFYASGNANYRRLPPLHPACSGTDSASPIALLYPGERRSVYVPVDLDGSRSRAVFEAVHREPAAVLHWHLDDGYLGSTETFHQMPVDASAGPHRITLVDQSGNRLERSFDVIGAAQGGS